MHIPHTLKIPVSDELRSVR